MKRLWIAAAMAVLLLVGCVWSVRAVSRTTDAIIAAVEANDLAAAWQQWDAAQPLLGALLMHNELDKTDRLFARVQQAAQSGLTGALALDRAELLTQLRALPELERPTLKNLF